MKQASQRERGKRFEARDKLVVVGVGRGARDSLSIYSSCVNLSCLLSGSPKLATFQDPAGPSCRRVANLSLATFGRVGDMRNPLASPNSPDTFDYQYRLSLASEIESGWCCCCCCWRSASFRRAKNYQVYRDDNLFQSSNDDGGGQSCAKLILYSVDVGGLSRPRPPGDDLSDQPRQQRQQQQQRQHPLQLAKIYF